MVRRWIAGTAPKRLVPAYISPVASSRFATTATFTITRPSEHDTLVQQVGRNKPLRRSSGNCMVRRWIAGTAPKRLVPAYISLVASSRFATTAKFTITRLSEHDTLVQQVGRNKPLRRSSGNCMVRRWIAGTAPKRLVPAYISPVTSSRFATTATFTITRPSEHDTLVQQVGRNKPLRRSSGNCMVRRWIAGTAPKRLVPAYISPVASSRFATTATFTITRPSEHDTLVQQVGRNKPLRRSSGNCMVRRWIAGTAPKRLVPAYILPVASSRFATTATFTITRLSEHDTLVQYLALDRLVPPLVNFCSTFSTYHCASLRNRLKRYEHNITRASLSDEVELPPKRTH
ncbi:hypothetical protein LF1_34520 [Rubripirellula obstinata]|uniref:Uncharacterized protein n=1 Tax=Rubripirellula obstinata TaxID=406547 RepID=A0A5B1CMW0_9BACT|nr:hypothetical protein LF1_34520 [Rubripirellula obstinata]